MMHMKEKHFVWHQIQFSSDLRGEQTCFPSAPGTLHNHHTTPPPLPLTCHRGVGLFTGHGDAVTVSNP